MADASDAVYQLNGRNNALTACVLISHLHDSLSVQPLWAPQKVSGELQVAWQSLLLLLLPPLLLPPLLLLPQHCLGRAGGTPGMVGLSHNCR
jgi:hypothetical protein